MRQRRPSNSERRLEKLQEEEAERDEQEGILELFHRDEQQRDEDAPLARDDEEQ